MASPFNRLVTGLVLNGSINQPVTRYFDKNEDCSLRLGLRLEHLILEISNLADAALTVTIKASNWGNNPPAANAPQDLVVTFEAGAAKIIGPFETFRFMQDNARVNINFQAASGTPSAEWRAYRLPKLGG